jgi:hypothetical protein
MKDLLWTREEVDELNQMFDATNCVFENSPDKLSDGAIDYPFSAQDRIKAASDLLSLLNMQREALEHTLNPDAIRWQ